VVSILLGHGAATLGDWHLTFKNNMLISSSMFQPSLSQNIGHPSPKDAAPRLRRTENLICTATKA